MRVLDVPNAHLALPFLSRNCFLPAATEARAMKWAQLIAAESHDVLLICLVK
jgi:hypothetical protein